MKESALLMDDLYKAAEMGREIRVSTLDPLLSEYIADINVNEALEMGEYLYTENCSDYNGRYINKSILFNDVNNKSFNYRNYNYLVALGCRLCGQGVNFDSFRGVFNSDGSIKEDKYLYCTSCGNKIVPIFTKSDIDPDFKPDDKGEDYVYMFGYRQGYIFEESGKSWWKDSINKLDGFNKLLKAKTANKSGKQTVKYHCDNCGNDTHTYSTFQARSADEGMSIMYECTNCNNRVVINT